MNDEKDDPKRGVTVVTAPPKEGKPETQPAGSADPNWGRHDRECDRRRRKKRKRAPRRRRESDWRREKEKKTRPRRKRQRRCEGIQKRQRGGRKMGSWVVETGKINLREHIYYSPSPYQVNQQKVMQE